MPAARLLSLTTEQRRTLEHDRRTDPRPYLRERCGAILQIADGASIRAVALRGLLTVRDPHTVADWLDRYEAKGRAGLIQSDRAARGYPP